MLPCFYSPEVKNINTIVTLSREESNHLAKTLRAKVGDRLRLIDGAGTMATAVVSEIHRNSVNCKIDTVEEAPKPTTRVHVYLAPPRHNIMAPLIRQCVELGVWSISLIECDFSVAKPRQKEEAFAREIITGAKQSGNPFFPPVNSMVKFNDALTACTYQKYYGAVPQESVGSLPSCKKGDLSLWVGPEGGFSPAELTALKDSGAQGICVSHWVLRVETALVSLLGVFNS